jgi:cobalt-zinc-cadmium efflux system protein
MHDCRRAGEQPAEPEKKREMAKVLWPIRSTGENYLRDPYRRGKQQREDIQDRLLVWHQSFSIFGSHFRYGILAGWLAGRPRHFLRRFSLYGYNKDMPASCNHSHDDEHAGLYHAHGPLQGPMLWLSLVVTLAFVAAEAIAGHFARSLALLSDAGHNFTDALGLGLAAYAVWVARKPANARKTFGYHRVAILTALFNAATLILIALGILYAAWQHFSNPMPVDSGLMLWVAGAAVLMNTAVAAMLRGGAKDNLNSRAAYLHMAGDALSALAVLAAAAVIKATGWTYADPSVSILIALFILWSSLGIVREATDILLEATPKGIDIDELACAIRGVAHVQAVHDLHVWTVTDGLNFLSCHVEVADTNTMAECASIVRQINDRLSGEYGIAHATIQTEIAGCCVSASPGDQPLYCGESAPSPLTGSGRR